MSFEAKWEIVKPGRLNLVGTKIEIIYGPGLRPFHVHCKDSCHGAFFRLGEAKEMALKAVDELLQMGVEP